MKMLNNLYILNTEIFDDEALFNEAYKLMDDVRKAKIDRLKYPKDKKLSLGAGFLLHKSLGDIGITNYALEYRMRDKPYLTGRDDIFFNISHSGNLVVLALSDLEVGVDVEKVRNFKESLINYVFSEQEIALAKDLSEVLGFTEDQAFTRLWTAKESIMKYSGMGIALEPKKITLSRRESDDGKSFDIAAISEAIDLSGISLTSYNLDGYQLTVCSECGSFEMIRVSG